MRPRILHLAYEDPTAPGSGGGSVRTREVDERLAAHFDIDAVSAAFPGARPYRAGGVSYRFLGSRHGGRFARQLSYFASVPALIKRRAGEYDLVVEDFGAPFSSIGVPRMTSTPVVGVVQWLFAEEKARQYHLPFHLVERAGVRTHGRLVAVSAGIAERVQELHPGARVDVVPNGLPEAVLARPVSSGTRSNLLYLGRLDVQHKGLDLLLDTFESVRHDVVQHLDVAGDGPGEAWLRREIDRRGLQGRVRLLGRVPAADRFDLLERYDAVLMPSRYESFGMIAAEGAAVGTPVLTFDIACLRDLVPPSLRTAPFDVGAYATLVRHLCNDASWRTSWAAPLRESVRRLSWDTLAEQQRRVYDDVLSISPTAPTAAV